MQRMTNLQYKLIINRTSLHVGVDSNIIFSGIILGVNWPL